MARDLVFYFDFSCPYAYLASTRVEALTERTGARLVPRPILLGGVFAAQQTAQNLAAVMPVPKARHNLLDMQRQAEAFGVPLVMPATHPMRTVTALRAVLASGQLFGPLVHRFFEAYWVRGLDISGDEGVATVLTEAGLDAGAILEAARSPAIKDELRARTQQAVDDGVFGVPAFVVDGELYWGQDRMDEVEAALGGPPPSEPGGGDCAPVDFWFDFSSPWAYLASTRVEQVFGASVRFRPMLLGAVFKAVGTPMVPLHSFPPGKQALQARDLQRRSDRWGAQLRFSSHFPIRTTTALRAALLAGPDSVKGRQLVHGLFRATWVEDRNTGDPTVIAACADAAGLDGAALVEQAGSPEARQLLFDATDAALDAGVFGAPTLVVEGAPTQLFWGGDRLGLAWRAASRTGAA